MTNNQVPSVFANYRVGPFEGTNIAIKAASKLIVRGVYEKKKITDINIVIKTIIESIGFHMLVEPMIPMGSAAADAAYSIIGQSIVDYVVNVGYKYLKTPNTKLIKSDNKSKSGSSGIKNIFIHNALSYIIIYLSRMYIIPVVKK